MPQAITVRMCGMQFALFESGVLEEDNSVVFETLTGSQGIRA
jgi:hypothetical protein